MALKHEKEVPARQLVGVELNPGPPRNNHLTEEERWRIVFLWKDMHLGVMEISRKMKIGRDAVTKLLKKYQDTGTVHDQPGRGRKRKLSETDEKKVRKEAKKRKFAPQIARESFKGVSVRTIQRTIKKTGLAYMKIQKVDELTDAQKQRRIEYSERMKDYSWRTVLFSDEKSFWLGASPDYAWQEPGNRIKEEVKKYPKKLHVWGAIGYHVKAKLYFFEDNLDGELYRKIINSRIHEKDLIYSEKCPKNTLKKWYFLQDNDPKHKAKATMELLTKLVGKRLISHPAMSPDLNPMEDIWSYLDRKVKESKISSISSLKRKLTKEWNSLPWSEIRKSVGSMGRRLTKCIESAGERLDY